MWLMKSKSETEIHKRCADEDLVIGDYHREKKPLSGMIDFFSLSQFSAPVPFNDDWEKKMIAKRPKPNPPVPPPVCLDPFLFANDGFCQEMKLPFLGEGGKGTLSLSSTQVPQKAPGEEKLKIEMTKPLWEVWRTTEEETKPRSDGSVACFRLPVFEQGPVACGICGGAHHNTACDLRKCCPTDKKVGKGFMVICFCGNILINGKCRHGCPPMGRVIRDMSFFKPPPLVSELFSTKSYKYI